MQHSEQAQWFAREVQPHEPTLRGYLHTVASTTDIDDVVQETYVRLLRAREQGAVRSARGLLFATARNVARDLFRRRIVAKTDSATETDCSTVADEAPTAGEVISRQQEIELLKAAIRELPERCRAVLLLRKFENCSHKEIARRLQISEHTVEAQLTKALHRCEEFFHRHGALPRK